MRMLEGVGVVGECCVMSCLLELLGGPLLLLLVFRRVLCRPVK